MALRSSSSARTPVISGVEPRGRPGMAALGLVVLAGGMVLWVLAGQGVVPLAPVAQSSHSSSTTSASTVNGITPSGGRPSGFLPFVDAQGRFALFTSNTWQSKAGTMPIAGQPQPDVVLAPTAATVPDWRIAFPTTAIPTNGVSYIDAINAIIIAEGGSNVSVRSGPGTTPVPIGLYQWWRLDFTAQLKSGVMAHIVALTPVLTNGHNVLVLETALILNYPTIDAQDFTPMLQSLVLQD